MLPRAALVKDERLWVACLDKGSVIEMDARFLDPMTAVYRQYRVAAGPSGMAMSEPKAASTSLGGPSAPPTMTLPELGPWLYSPAHFRPVRVHAVAPVPLFA